MHRKFKSPLLQGWKRAQKTVATGHRSDRSRLLGGHCASTIPVKYKLPRGNTKQASFFQLWHIPNSAQYRVPVHRATCLKLLGMLTIHHHSAPEQTEAPSRVTVTKHQLCTLSGTGRKHTCVPKYNVTTSDYVFPPRVIEKGSQTAPCNSMQKSIPLAHEQVTSSAPLTVSLDYLS